MGSEHWSGMSHLENLAHGVSLSALCCPPSRADTIWPAGMLLSRGWWVKGVSYAEGGDGL